MAFKESLTILIVSALFIVLGARLSLEQLALVPWVGMGLFLVFLIGVVRPVAVMASTMFSRLPLAERVFMAFLAPRGIVAAAVASVFALRLDQEAYPDARLLVPATFATIIGTVTIYGLGASWLARKLGLTKPANQGFLVAGAGRVERTIAEALKAEGRNVVLVDTNMENVAQARLQGFQVLHGSVLSRTVWEETQMAPIGRLLALTANDEVNALAVTQYQKTFNRADVFQLAPTPRESRRQEKVSEELQGRVLFMPEATYELLERRIEAGHKVRRTPLTAEYPYGRLAEERAGRMVPLFLVTGTGEVVPFTAELPPKPKAGEVVISLS